MTEKSTKNRYCIIERDVDVAGYPFIVENVDGSGILYFDTLADSSEFMAVYCKDGFIIPMYE